MRRATDDQVDQVLQLVRGGADLESACGHAGVDVTWLMLRAPARTRRQVERAASQADLGDLAVIGSAAKDSWQAAAKRLEQRRISRRETDFERLRDLTT
jgi:hypothetical protein